MNRKYIQTMIYPSFMFSRSSLKALVYVILVAAVEGADKILVLLVQLMYEYGPVSAEHTIDFQGSLLFSFLYFGERAESGLEKNRKKFPEWPSPSLVFFLLGIE